MQIISKSLINSGQSATLDSANFYDGLGRLIESKKASATPGQYVMAGMKTYTARGLVEKSFLPQYTSNDLNTLDPLPADTVPHVTNYYDAQGRTLKSVSPDNSYVNTVYEPFQTTVYDANGHMNVANYDSFGRLVTRGEYVGADGRDVQNPASAYTLYATTQYQYDAQGNLTKVIDAKGNATTITYDKLGRKTGMNDPDMHSWTYAYDDNGNLTKQNDANAKQMTFNYDVLNRLTSKSTIIPSVVMVGMKTSIANIPSVLAAYSYDDLTQSNGIGRLNKVNYGGNTAQFNYDTLGREVASTKTISGVTYRVNRQYDNLNRLTKLVYPDATNVGYTYDAAGQANGVNLFNSDGTIKSNLVTDVKYNALGQMTKVVYGNGVSTVNTYDPVTFKLTRIQTMNTAGNKLQDLSYTYDSVGNITVIRDAVNTATQTFKYDALNRLLSANGAGMAKKIMRIMKLAISCKKTA